MDDVPLTYGSKRQRTVWHYQNIWRMVDTCLLIAILISLIYGVVYIVPKVNQAGSTLDKYGVTLNDAARLFDRLNHIPEQDWEFLTNQTEQEALLELVRDKLQMIPPVTWNFITNTTEQTRLIHLIESFINSRWIPFSLVEPEALKENLPHRVFPDFNQTKKSFLIQCDEL